MGDPLFCNVLARQKATRRLNGHTQRSVINGSGRFTDTFLSISFSNVDVMNEGRVRFGENIHLRGLLYYSYSRFSPFSLKFYNCPLRVSVTVFCYDVRNHLISKFEHLSPSSGFIKKESGRCQRVPLM